MVINAQPRVVSHARFTPPERSSTSHSNRSNYSSTTSKSSTSTTSAERRRAAWEMSYNCAFTGPQTLGEACDWEMRRLDEEMLGESFGNPLYSDAQDAKSYYGQRTAGLMAAPGNASSASAQPPPYAYYQPSAHVNFARTSAPTSFSGTLTAAYQPYSSMVGYCRPSAIHNHNHDSGSETEYGPYAPEDTNLYSGSLSGGFGMQPPYSAFLASPSNQQAFNFGLGQVSWYHSRPPIDPDVTISPAMAGATMAPQMGQSGAGGFGGSFGSESVPSLSPGEKRGMSYESSELSFSDSEEEERGSEGEQGRAGGKSNKERDPRKSSQGPGQQENSRREAEAEKTYLPIAPNLGHTSGGAGAGAQPSQREATHPLVPPLATLPSSLPRRSTITSTRDEERDWLLVELKRQGYSYKDIKRRGNFKEAESTLRGRYRTLTKSKEERVRRPCWTEKDERLLREGVGRFGGGGGGGGGAGAYGKVKWMLVAGYIKERGGSYHFGNATCRKKWDEMLRAERGRG